MKNTMNTKITDRTSFIQFLELFHKDLTDNPHKWENTSLSGFLEAMVRYTEDIDGYYLNTKQDIDPYTASWQVFADILKGASMYE